MNNCLRDLRQKWISIEMNISYQKQNLVYECCLDFQLDKKNQSKVTNNFAVAKITRYEQLRQGTQRLKKDLLKKNTQRRTIE